jgi:hypothetical protein
VFIAADFGDTVQVITAVASVLMGYEAASWFMCLGCTICTGAHRSSTGHILALVSWKLTCGRPILQA